MPLNQPKRDNPLMRRYFREAKLSGKQLAQRCGVSHSQVNMARTRNVGPDNAERIGRGVARLLGLSEVERLRLQAEIMGHPEDLLRAYLGNGVDAARSLVLGKELGKTVVNTQTPLAHATGRRVIRSLQEMGAPEEVVEQVRRRTRVRPPGRVTNRQSGLEARNRRAEGLFLARLFKPETLAAVERSGQPRTQLARSAGVSRETMRKALYERVGRDTAARIAAVLVEAAGLPEAGRETLVEEMAAAPQKNF